MAKGDPWKIGVWHPFPNPQFERRTRVTSKLGANYVSGSQITLDAGEQIFFGAVRKGDIVRVGTSSNSTNRGAFAYGRVTAVSTVGKTVTMYDLFGFSSFLFNVGDEVMAWGSRVSEGWVSNEESYNWFFGGCVHDNLDYLFGSPYAMLLNSAVLGAQSNFITNSRKYLLKDTKYYGAAIYKMQTNQSNDTRAFLLGNDNATIFTMAFVPSVSWVEVNSSGATGAPNLGNFPAINIYRNPGNQAVNLYLKTLVYMHAAGTSQEGSGVLTVGRVPVSVGIKVKSNTKDVETIEDDVIPFNASVGNNTKCEITAQFEKVSSTALDDLLLLEEWQTRGELLCLNPYLFDIPKWFIGKMEIRNITRDFETKLVSFTLMFEELV